MEWLGGLFNMAGNLGAAGINYATAIDVANKNAAASERLAKLQNQYNIDMWNMNNEYNSPKNQLQRLIDAGLNPNLAYGTVSAGNSQRPPEQVTGTYHLDNSVDWQQAMHNLGDQVLSFLSAKEDIKGKTLDNFIRALHLKDLENDVAAKDGLMAQDPYGERSVITYRDGGGVKGLLYRYLRGLSSGLDSSNWWHQYRQNQLNLQSTHSANTAANTAYRRMVNDWFETNQWFNLINGGLNTITKFIPWNRVLGGGRATKYFNNNQSWRPTYSPIKY